MNWFISFICVVDKEVIFGSGIRCSDIKIQKNKIRLKILENLIFRFYSHNMFHF